MYVIRPGKWNQLKNAKKKLIAKRGGVRRSERTGGNDGTAKRTGKSYDATTTKQASKQREMGRLGGGLVRMDDTTRMADGGGGGGPDSPECESTQLCMSQLWALFGVIFLCIHI